MGPFSPLFAEIIKMSLDVVVTEFHSASLSSPSFNLFEPLSLVSCFTLRSLLRTAPSPETLTGHSQLTTTSKTLEETDKTPSIRSAK